MKQGQMNKPIQIGFSVLERSKLIMARFWYDTVLPIFGEENVQLLYSDTDSYFIQVTDFTWKETVLALKSYIDFSNLPPDHCIFDSVDYKKYASDRKAQFSFVKIDTAENVIHAFLGEKKKSYSLFMSKSADAVFDIHQDSMGLKIKAAKKGCPALAAKKMRTKALLGLIIEPGIVKTEFKKLQSKKHTISMLHQEKVVSNSFDNSAFYKDCNMCNVPFNCSIKRIHKCRSVECRKNKLLVKIWYRISK